MANETVEELMIRKIKGSIRGIKGGRINPEDDKEATTNRLVKLKISNLGMYDDLKGQYNIAVTNFKPSNILANRKANR